jgi:hypothetical protein
MVTMPCFVRTAVAVFTNSKRGPMLQMTRTRRTTKRILGCASFCAALAGATDALADPRMHDGFYMNLSTGLGYLSTSASVPGQDVTFAGVTIPSVFLLGGTPVKGLVIGGGLLTDYSLSPKYKVNGTEVPTTSSVSQYLVGFGPFVEFYPNPAEGLHFHGMVGFGALETSVNGNAGGSDPTGFLVALGAGYDFWVGDQWSIGVLGRFAYAPLSLNGLAYTSIAPAVLATFTYH